eukprot:CAMPEP_0195078004 /NCGR_PEP_ID=MMETSP0448-20130528/20299_1 /TAXON_ID=66468 /ORGANISM="Heterocapsa triquestra, Strain CCMP 448" /LENGTH=43 /DNA_ID= /DNA_START= /DNA_END= /DNA_ORIENTATION=
MGERCITLGGAQLGWHSWQRAAYQPASQLANSPDNVTQKAWLG